MWKLQKLRTFILVLVILLIITGLGVWQIKPNSQTLTTRDNPSPLYNDFHLVIPSLNINAPVIADVDGVDKNAYFAALENGVAHFRGTAKPGEHGNIFIFGHSSFYWYKPGHYKEIFKNLEELKTGDEIILWYQEKEFKYKITETKVVEPSDISALSSTNEEQVTLMTCVPPGTTLKRLIIIAKRT